MKADIQKPKDLGRWFLYNPFPLNVKLLSGNGDLKNTAKHRSNNYWIHPKMKFNRMPACHPQACLGTSFPKLRDPDRKKPHESGAFFKLKPPL
jgi:hypothetical protein